MKSLKKFIVSLVIAVPMLFIPSGVGRADLFGAADYALLLQQMAQFAQDDLISRDGNRELAARLRKIKQIASTIQNIGAAGSAMQSIMDVADCGIRMKRAYDEMDSYINYMKNFGSNFRLTNLNGIYYSFQARTSNVINSCLKAYSSLVQMFDDTAEPLDLMTLMNKMKEDTEKKNDSDAEEVTTRGAEMCVDVASDMQKKMDTGLNSCTFCPA